jgi:hypothetical protein
LRWHTERCVESPSYIMKQSWISGNPHPCHHLSPWGPLSCHPS